MAVRKLSIARSVKLPVEIVTQTVGILAKRRAGKSYLARRLSEELIRAGRPLMLYREGDIMNGISPADLVAGAVTVERVP